MRVASAKKWGSWRAAAPARRRNSASVYFMVFPLFSRLTVVSEDYLSVSSSLPAEDANPGGRVWAFRHSQAKNVQRSGECGGSRSLDRGNPAAGLVVVRIALVDHIDRSVSR